MTLLPLLLGTALAEPFCLDAGLGFGRGPDQAFLIRGSLIYGVAPRLQVIAESGNQPEWGGLTLGFGPMLLPIESRWWTLRLAAIPELVVPLTSEAPRGHTLGPLAIETRGSVQLSWLAFWGLSFNGRVDRVVPFDGDTGWTEWSLGFAGRM